MKRFDFKLEKILNLREFYERQAEVELAKAISAKDSIDIRLKTIAKLKIDAAKKINTVLVVDDLHTTQNYMTRLNIEKENLLKEIVFAEEVVKQRRAEYIEAMSNRKVISKLKEKKINFWKKENLKAEDEFIDDIVSFKSGKELRNL